MSCAPQLEHVIGKDSLGPLSPPPPCPPLKLARAFTRQSLQRKGALNPFLEFLLFSSPYELLVAVFTLNVLILKCHLELTPFRMQISTNYIRILLQIYKYLWIRNEFGLIRHNSHVLFFLFILSV